MGFKVCGCVLAVALCGPSWADKWVSASAATGGTGTETSPYQTIQQAIDAAAANETIWVKPGEYKIGSTRDTISDSKTLTRVLITKRLRIESTDGADVTHIVGAGDASDATSSTARSNGLGEDSVRCVCAMSAAEGSVLKGFTIRDGRSRYAGNVNCFGSHGGGVASQNDGGLSVVDCVVSNCVATRGGACYRVKLIRSFLAYNKATNNGGAATRMCRHYACVLAHNGDSSDSFSKSAISDPYAVIHCSLFGNGNGGVYMESGYAAQVCNTLAVLEGNNTQNCRSFNFGSSITKSPTASHCVVSTINDATKDVKPNLSEVTATDAVWETLVSPYTGDFRVVAGGLCDATGDASLSAPDWVPEEFRGFDFYGKPLVVSGKANIGAVAASGKVNGGVHVLLGSKTWSVDGYEKNLDYGEILYARGTAAPTTITLRETGTNAIFNFEQSWKPGWNWNRYFDNDGTLVLTLPPPGTVVTNWSNGAKGGVVYVDPRNGNDTYDGKSDTFAEAAKGPVKTLKRAIELAVDHTIIRCAEGTYDEGTVTAGSVPTRAALTKHVVLRGAGAGKSIIKGNYDTTTPAEHGCGDNAVRCVYVDNNNKSGAVIGFTLLDGCVKGNATGPQAQFEGGGFYAPAFNSRAQLLDCVVTNCAGSRGGVMFGGYAHRTKFVGNNLCAAGSESFRSLILSTCVIQDNNPAKGGYYTIANQSLIVINTTFAGNGNPDNNSTIFGQINGGAAVALNCVADGVKQNSMTGYAAGNWQSYRSGQVGWNHVTEMKLADLSVRDLRPRADSPVVGGGSTGDGTKITTLDQCNQLTTAEWYAMTTSTDIEGKPFLYVNGKPVAGAYQTPVAVVAVEVVVPGEIEPTGTRKVVPGDSITVTANGASARQFLGFWVNGELVSQSEKTFTYTVPAEIPRAPYVLKAAYNTDWYVNPDPAKGNDANTGWTPETAKRTLVEAMKGPVAGDTVHAAVGVYSEGTAPDAANSTTKCRVNVPAGVTLLGDDRDGTIIEGKASATASSGLGTDSVRGVYLNAGAVLKNLTVRKGYTHNGAASAESFGAGVYGASRDTTLVEDCTIRDCRGSRAGAGQLVTFNRCRLIDNYGASTGAAGRGCNFFNTYISGCSGNSRPMQDSYYFVNCTYDVDKIDASTARNAFEGGSGRIVNSVFLQPNVKLSSYLYSATNVVFVTGSGITAANVPSRNVSVRTLEEIALDAGRRPTQDSCLTDAGTLDFIRKLSDTVKVDCNFDCEGGQRVYNDNKIDIGAFEYDWRAQYAADLKSRRVVVTAAEPQILEEDGRVKIPSGTLEATWRGGTGKRTVSAQVTGTGTLAMYVGDAEDPEAVWTVSSDPVSYSWKPAGDLSLRFVYEPGAADTGAAYLSAFEDSKGMSIVVR